MAKAKAVASDMRGLAPGYHCKNWPFDSEDDAPFPRGCTAYVGTGGEVKVRALLDPPGQTTIFVVPAGGQIPVRLADIIGDEETTAEDIVLIWSPEDNKV